MMLTAAGHGSVPAREGGWAAMGSKDNPSGSGGRTIIRAPQRNAGTPGPVSPSDPTIIYAPGTALPTGTIISTAKPPTRTSPQGEPPSSESPHSGQDFLDAFLDLDYPATNGLMAAAAPLLILLGHLRLTGTKVEAEQVGQQLSAAIDEFGWKAAETDIDDEDIRIAHYVLCETADDIARNLPGIGATTWTAHSLLRQHYQVEAPGNGFFDALNTVLAAPQERCDLLELMHACLSLGFEGPYRGTSHGQDLEPVRRDVYEAIRYFRPAQERLSPHWQPVSLGPARPPRRLPVWAIAAAGIALVAGAFFWMRTTVTNQSEAVAQELLALVPSSAIVIQRAEVAPPVVEEKPATQTSQIERIRSALAQDIASGALSVDTRGDFVVIDIDNSLLFDPGTVETKPDFNAVASRMGAALDGERGPIAIVGHTDNIRPRPSGPFKSNHDLSLARAEAVRTQLSPSIQDPSRISVDGKGQDEPIADNSTPEGRAKNRRIEVMIRREETL